MVDRQEGCGLIDTVSASKLRFDFKKRVLFNVQVL